MQSLHELEGENLELATVCDVDESVIGARLAAFEKLGGKRPQVYTDIRKLLDDRSIEAVFHATPAHWHSLGALSYYFRLLNKLGYAGFIGVEVTSMIHQKSGYQPLPTLRVCYERMASAFARAGLQRPRKSTPMSRSEA